MWCGGPCCVFAVSSLSPMDSTVSVHSGDWVAWGKLLLPTEGCHMPKGFKIPLMKHLITICQPPKAKKKHPTICPPPGGPSPKARFRSTAWAVRSALPAAEPVRDDCGADGDGNPVQGRARQIPTPGGGTLLWGLQHQEKPQRPLQA